MILHPNCNVFLDAGIDEEVTATYLSDVERNHQVQQPPTDVVEVPDVEVEPSSAHQFEVQEANQPLQQHLAVKSFYGTSRCGRQLKRRIREYSPPLVNAKKRKH